MLPFWYTVQKIWTFVVSDRLPSMGCVTFSVPPQGLDFLEDLTWDGLGYHLLCLDIQNTSVALPATLDSLGTCGCCRTQSLWGFSCLLNRQWTHLSWALICGVWTEHIVTSGSLRCLYHQFGLVLLPRVSFMLWWWQKQTTKKTPTKQHKNKQMDLDISTVIQA